MAAPSPWCALSLLALLGFFSVMKLQYDAAVAPQWMSSHRVCSIDKPCWPQVVARCAISTTTGACFGGTVALIVHLLYTRFTTGKGVWVRSPRRSFPTMLSQAALHVDMRCLNSAALPAAACCGGTDSHACCCVHNRASLSMHTLQLPGLMLALHSHPPKLVYKMHPAT